jgi:hypothetical protein
VILPTTLNRYDTRQAAGEFDGEVKEFERLMEKQQRAVERKEQRELAELAGA